MWMDHAPALQPLVGVGGEDQWSPQQAAAEGGLFLSLGCLLLSLAIARLAAAEHWRLQGGAARPAAHGVLLCREPAASVGL